jgi:hypothetical protein
MVTGIVDAMEYEQLAMSVEDATGRRSRVFVDLHEFTIDDLIQYLHANV